MSKKRGRRENKILDDNEDSKAKVITQKKTNHQQAVILALPSEGLDISEEEYTDESSVEESSSDEIFINDIPINRACSGCIEKDIIINDYKAKLRAEKDATNANKLYFVDHPKTVDAKGNTFTVTKTKIDCWYHGRPHDNYACPLIDRKEGDTYVTVASACSLDCAMGYNFFVLKDSRIYERQTLTIQWFRKACSIPITAKVEIRIPRNIELLVHRGGNVTIEEFSKGFTILVKKKGAIVPKTRPDKLMIDNRREDDDDKDKTGLVLERKTPIRKPSSVIASLDKMKRKRK